MAVPSVFTTTDLDAAIGFLRGHYTAHTTRRCGRAAHFCFEHTLVAGECLSVAQVSCAGWLYEADVDPVSDLLVVHVLSGRLWLSCDGEQVQRLGPDDLVLYPWSTPCRAGFDDLRATVARLDRADVTRLTTELTGVPTEELRFTALRPTTTQTAAHWLALVRHLTRDVLPTVATTHSPLIRSAACRLLVASLLETFPNSAAGHAHANEWVASPAVRRAVAYIQDHAAEPIELTDIADAARVGTRGLQLGFRRHLDTTPLAYLRRIRLERAHLDLTASDPAKVTVSEIAQRWGFAHQGRFAAAYRRRYGQPPSHSLRD